MSSPRAQRWLRFLLGGCANTAFTYALYLALNIILSYQVAYLIAYVTGIFFAYWFNATVVFHVPLCWKGLFSYPIIYVIQYAIAALLLGGLVEIIGISEYLAPLIVVAFVVPLTYVMNKLLLGWSAPNPKDGKGNLNEKTR